MIENRGFGILEPSDSRGNGIAQLPELDFEGVDLMDSRVSTYDSEESPAYNRGILIKSREQLSEDIAREIELELAEIYDLESENWYLSREGWHEDGDVYYSMKTRAPHRV